MQIASTKYPPILTENKFPQFASYWLLKLELFFPRQIPPNGILPFLT